MKKSILTVACCLGLLWVQGFGALAAAPIAREMLDYWITGENRLGLPAPSHLSHVPPGTAQRRQGAAK